MDYLCEWRQWFQCVSYDYTASIEYMKLHVDHARKPVKLIHSFACACVGYHYHINQFMGFNIQRINMSKAKCPHITTGPTTPRMLWMSIPHPSPLTCTFMVKTMIRRFVANILATHLTTCLIVSWHLVERIATSVRARNATKGLIVCCDLLRCWYMTHSVHCFMKNTIQIICSVATTVVAGLLSAVAS